MLGQLPNCTLHHLPDSFFHLFDGYINTISHKGFLKLKNVIGSATKLLKNVIGRAAEFLKKNSSHISVRLFCFLETSPPDLKNSSNSYFSLDIA